MEKLGSLNIRPSREYFLIDFRSPEIGKNKLERAHHTFQSDL
jgi:hypothetical protein